MGTRSITVFEDEDGEEVARLYRQMDGYPEGHGLEMAQFFEGNQIVNGYGMSGEDIFNYNGMGDVAAQLVAQLKTFHWPLMAGGTRNKILPSGKVGKVTNLMPDATQPKEYGHPRVGEFYLVGAGTTGMGEEYIYTVFPFEMPDGTTIPFIKIEDTHQKTPLFEGSPTELITKYG